MANIIPNKAIAKDEGECWLIIHGAVCDVTDWIHEHPGGGVPLLKKAGADAAMVLKMSHPEEAGAEHVLKEKVAGWAIWYLEGGKLARFVVVVQPEAPAVVQPEAPAPAGPPRRSQREEVSCFAQIVSSLCGGGPTEEEKAAKRKAALKAALKATKALIVAGKAKDAATCKGGADMNAANADLLGYTALHFAGQGDLDTVSTLMAYGAAIDPQSEPMETPLLMAARGKHKEVVDYLLENGADSEAETDYQASLRKSAQTYIDKMLGSPASACRL